MDLIRGAVVEKVGNDVFGNFNFVVNAHVTDVNNLDMGQHSDVFQVYQNPGQGTKPVENRLAYNVYATDAHYQGIMRTSLETNAKNNAFVNVFIEMREPGNLNEKSIPGIKSVLNSAGHEDHLLVWHCSFPYSQSTWRAKATNSSFIGNIFWQLRNSQPKKGAQWPQGTEWLYNHYMYAYDVTSTCIPTSLDVHRGADCPALRSHINDTGNLTATWGDGVLNLFVGDDEFGYPVAESVLVDALPTSYVPVDALGNERDARPDVGALEYDNGTNPTDCIYDNTSYQNIAIPRQTADFTIRAEIEAHNGNMDAVTGFGAIEGSHYTHYAVLVRLNNQGNIDARNYGTYTSDETLSYTPGVVYAFKIDVDMQNNTYDVYVTPENTGVTTQIADDYAFRREQADITEFNYMFLRSYFGAHDVCNIEVVEE